MREFNYLVFMGRFQPLHNGHLHIIDRALQLADKVIVLVGSANLARSPRNPFTYRERSGMLVEAVSNSVLMSEGVKPSRLLVRPVPDFPYNDAAWVATVQETVNRAILADNNPSPEVTLTGLRDFRVGLIGHSKDHTSYYLKLFPEWKAVDVLTQFSTLSATDLRENYLRRAPHLPDVLLVPAGVRSFMSRFILTEHFKWLVAEEDFYRDYRKAWEGTPYPPFICCVDAVVVQSGHILLVRRGARPGLGLLALPGGHVDANETFRAAAIRELREETKLADPTRNEKVPPAILDSYIDDSKTRLFDHPNRSQRGRVVTQAYYFEVPNSTQLLRIRGADDAASAAWHRLGDLRATDFHDDHAAIIQEMTGYTLPVPADWGL